MDEDSDLPPTLVKAFDTAKSRSENPAQAIADLQLSKVPLTIITGEFRSKQGAKKISVGLIFGARLPRRWQNYTGELHLERAARQEDSGYSEWLVYSLYHNFTNTGLLICNCRIR